MTNSIEGTQGTRNDNLASARPTYLDDEVDLVLPPTAGSHDPVAALAELMLEMRIEDRCGAREQNRIEQDRIEAACDAHVDAIHEEADALVCQGWVSGVAQIGGGALQACGGFGNAFGVVSDSALRGFEGAGELVGGVGTVGGAVLGSDVLEAQADQAAAQTAQGTAEQRAEQASTEMQNARDDLRSLLEHIQRIHDAELAARNAALFLK